MVILLLSLACADPAKDGPTGSETDADTDADADADADADTDTDPVPDPDRPVISDAAGWCYLHQTGDQYWNWDAACSADDPQGTDTLEGGDLVVSLDGIEVTSHRLACDRDLGRCTTSFTEDATGVICVDADQYTFRFTVYDEDGNTSEPVEVPGAQDLG